MIGGAGMRICAVLMGSAVLMAGAGCASKKVASTSDEQSTTMKGTGATVASPSAGPSSPEKVKEEPMAFVDQAPAAAAPLTPMTRESSLSPGGPSAAPNGSGMAAVPSTSGPDDIYFDFDQYNIRSDARNVLERGALWLRSQGGKSVLIEGHCDERGTLAYNLVLGEKRAKSTKRYLEELGVSASRIQTTSYGEVRPFCTDHNEGCWSKNRRAHFVVR
jgi:peptidoglycan-associated lipoprotein